MKDCFNLPIFKPSKSWLVGRINSPLFRKDSLLFKLFSTMDKVLDVFRLDAITTMNSNCICSQFFNIKRKEHELGIPNSLSSDENENRIRNIYIANFLMHSNGASNIIRIADLYAVNVTITQEEYFVNDCFDYTFPIEFKSVKDNRSTFSNSCSFPYEIGFTFQEECRLFPYRRDDKDIATETHVTIATDSTEVFNELSSIYTALATIDTKIVTKIESFDSNPYTKEYINICEE